MSETIKEDSLLERPRFVDRLEDCFFYHAMDLPVFGLVRAHWDLRGRFDDYVGGVEVAGKSVLDIGAATGFLSFEAEKRGAARVVSFDMSDVRQQTFLPFKDKLYHRDYESFISYHTQTVERWKNAYWLCHRLLGSKAGVYYGNITTCRANLECLTWQSSGQCSSPLRPDYGIGLYLTVDEGDDGPGHAAAPDRSA